MLKDVYLSEYCVMALNIIYCTILKLIRPLRLVNISMTDVYSGIQWNIYVRPFYTPLSSVSPPPPSHTGLI